MIFWMVVLFVLLNVLVNVGIVNWLFSVNLVKMVVVFNFFNDRKFIFVFGFFLFF